MSKMISVSSGFQYSVNIGYDLNNEDKIRNFIPTAAALNLLESILLSTSPASTERARVLIGAYGKGKSHIMLMILSLLEKKDITLFEQLLSKIEGTKLYQLIRNYYESDERLFPVIVSGTNTSLTQSFILALQRSLSESSYLDIMPETNYKAAVTVIQRWKADFPETYKSFCEQISVTPDVFTERLLEFDSHIYEEFERIYPVLTSGSIFNPFLGFDVVDLYENAAKGLRKKGYTGIYVVYDEFSKYLEANISSASVSDTKMLQDFAEKCNRSGSSQMHIMLISHKEIANYIDVLPKQKVDGWRGVSERFLHVRLSNNFSQTYEIIASVILKEPELWCAFCKENAELFNALKSRYLHHPIFAGLSDEEAVSAIVGCYPLHPVSTFILPRLSEIVAQNERTLFTFLSANGQSTLPDYLNQYDDKGFALITPDIIYDYFEPLFKKEVYSGALHDNYILTETILEQLESDSLESKIVKAISLIYVLEQFEKLKPTKEELFGMYSVGYSHEEIECAINNLIEKDFVVYLKRSNNHLQLKQTSGIDVYRRIKDVAESQKAVISISSILNRINSDNYLYPSRYNDSHEMVRFFSFVFISEEMLENIDFLHTTINEGHADGVVFGVLISNHDYDQRIIEKTKSVSSRVPGAVFVVPKSYTDIEQIARDLDAVADLKNQSTGDRVLFDEYEVIYEDLRDYVSLFISAYTRPEKQLSYYVYDNKVQSIFRRASLSELLSTICDNAYSMTPVVNNEALNRNEATSMARNSRNKVVAALLRTQLEPGLGLSGTGQEVSIMRSTLVRTGILEDYENNIKVNLHPVTNPLISNLFDQIEEFFRDSRGNGPQRFSELYHRIRSPESKIALRKELMPIYLAVALHMYRQQIVISDRFGQMLLNADTISQINAKPENYCLEYIDWDSDKEEYINKLERVFSEYIIDSERNTSPYDFMVFAIKRWYMALPKYTKEMRIGPDGKKLDKGYSSFIKLVRQNPSGHVFLFEEVPKAFGYQSFTVNAADNINGAKQYFDGALDRLKELLCNKIKSLFLPTSRQVNSSKMSLRSVIRDWCEELDKRVFEQLFADGTDKYLALFNTISNDENLFIERIAKATTDLRIEDWNDQTITICIANLQKCKATAEAFHAESGISSSESLQSDSTAYQITYVTSEGLSETRRFERLPDSNRSKLLKNKITADIDSFGQALTEAEKRQVLMEVLIKLC